MNTLIEHTSRVEIAHGAAPGITGVIGCVFCLCKPHEHNQAKYIPAEQVQPLLFVYVYLLVQANRACDWLTRIYITNVI
jgi:hypothetical protein